jgi:hypothetical protein
MFGQSKSTAPRLLKFEAPKDPIDQENEKRLWEMPHIQKVAYLDEKFEKKKQDLAASGLSDGEKLAISNAMEVFKQQMELEAWDAEANECYMRGFRDFLQGKSKYNSEQYKHLVPWTNNPLVGKDIEVYLDAVLDKKIEFDAKIARMFNTKMAPRNLKDAWLYYVFIVTGKKPPTDIFLKAWDAFYPFQDSRFNPKTLASIPNPTPQDGWVQTASNAPPRQEQKGIDGPVESCDYEPKLDPPEPDTKPDQGNHQQPPTPAVPVQTDPTPPVAPQEATIPMEEDDDDEEKLKDNRKRKAEEELEEGLPTVYNKTTNEAYYEKVRQTREWAVPIATAVHESTHRVNEINRDTADPVAQDSIRRGNNRVEQFTFRATTNPAPRAAYKHTKAAQSELEKSRWQVKKLESALAIEKAKAQELIEEKNKQVEELSRLNHKLREEVFGFTTKYEAVVNSSTARLKEVVDKYFSENESLKQMLAKAEALAWTNAKTQQTTIQGLKREVEHVRKLYEQAWKIAEKTALKQAELLKENAELKEGNFELTEEFMKQVSKIQDLQRKLAAAGENGDPRNAEHVKHRLRTVNKADQAIIDEGMELELRSGKRKRK